METLIRFNHELNKRVNLIFRVYIFLRVIIAIANLIAIASQFDDLSSYYSVRSESTRLMKRIERDKLKIAAFNEGFSIIIDISIAVMVRMMTIGLYMHILQIAKNTAIPESEIPTDPPLPIEPNKPRKLRR